MQVELNPSDGLEKSIGARQKEILNLLSNIFFPLIRSTIKARAKLVIVEKITRFFKRVMFIVMSVTTIHGTKNVTHMSRLCL